MPYFYPADLAMMPGLRGLKLRHLGLPTLEEYLQAYVREARRQE